MSAQLEPLDPEDSGGGPPNGNRWLALDEGSKYAYIVGFIEGMFQGHCFTTWGLPGTEADGPAYLHATKSYETHWNRLVAKVAYQQFLDGLNKLFEDHRNRKIAVKNGIYIVMCEIAGQSGQDMELMIEAWRRKAASGGEEADAI